MKLEDLRKLAEARTTSANAETTYELVILAHADALLDVVRGIEGLKKQMLSENEWHGWFWAKRIDEALAKLEAIK